MSDKIIIGLIFLIALLIGFYIGYNVKKYSGRLENVGTLRIDRSDPEDPPYFFLEVTNVGAIKDGKTITMSVREEDYIPQK